MCVTLYECIVLWHDVYMCNWLWAVGFGIWVMGNGHMWMDGLDGFDGFDGDDAWLCMATVCLYNGI